MPLTARSVSQRIDGAEKLERIVGYRRSFHDAEVLRDELDREKHGAVRGTTSCPDSASRDAPSPWSRASRSR